MREAVRIPVVGNGDIQEAQDILNMRSETACDGVMVARASTARPWIFWQVGETLGLPLQRDARATRHRALQKKKAASIIAHSCDFAMNSRRACRKSNFPPQALPRLEPQMALLRPLPFDPSQPLP